MSRKMLASLMGLLLLSMLVSACGKTEPLTPTVELASTTATIALTNAPRTPSPLKINRTLDVLPTQTPTNTPTRTFTPSPTSSLTPTVTPTPSELSITTANYNQLALVQTLGKGIPYDVAWSPNGRVLAISGQWGIDFYDASSYEMLRSFDLPMGQIVFNQDGSLLAGTIGTKILILDALTGEPTKELATSSRYIDELAYSPGGTWLAMLGTIKGDPRTYYLEVWDAAEGEKLYTKSDFGCGAAIAFSPDGRTLVLSASSGILVLDASNGELSRSFPNETYDVAFSPDGSTLFYTADYYHFVDALNFESGNFTKSISTGMDSGCGFGLSPDGSTLVLPCFWQDDEWKTQFRNVQTGELMYSVPYSPNSSTAMAFKPQSNILAFVDRGQVYLFDIDNGQIIHTFEYSDAVTAMTLDTSKKSENSILAVGYHDKSIALWDTNSGELRLKIANLDFTPYQIIFSPEGRFIASRNNNEMLATALVWDTTDGKLIGTFPCRYEVISSIVITPDGQVSGVDCMVGMTRPTSELPILPGDPSTNWDQISVLNDSPDGRFIAAGTWMGMIYIYDKASLQLLYMMTGHDYMCGDGGCSGVNQVEFSPYGSLLASSGFDGTIRLWDASTGQALKTLYHSPESTTFIIFTPDGLTLLAAGGGSVYVFGIPAPQTDYPAIFFK